MKSINVALVGNPNSGKSTIFNQLTGLRQKTSNFPGVTVEQKSGDFALAENVIHLIDLPGTYSLFPNSMDEKVVGKILCNPKNIHHPDLIIYIADVNHLERHLLLFTQILDLKIPMILVLNMIDIFENDDNSLNLDLLQKNFTVPILTLSARNTNVVEVLKSEISKFISYSNQSFTLSNPFYNIPKNQLPAIHEASTYFNEPNPYRSKLLLNNSNWLDFLSAADRIQMNSIIGQYKYENIKSQIDETMGRFAKIQPIVNEGIINKSNLLNQQTLRWDNIITHRFWGIVIFFGLMFLMFQSIFSFAEYPMTWIEEGFAGVGNFIKTQLDHSWFSQLLVDGILSGLSGVVVFIPQIALLFFFVSLLEESGYMSRVVYMFDHVMQKFGLNGRSMVALISSGACAIPAIMSSRTIGNWKERIITIMVSPLIPCSARIPVYTVLIALMVPYGSHTGFFNLQGLVFMGLYLIGIITSLIVAFIFHKILRTEEKSYLMMELPIYKKPVWSNVFLEMKGKVMSFILESGKIIIIISIALWFLSSYGPHDEINQAANDAKIEAIKENLNTEETEYLIQAKKLESSYAGHIGKWIEPAIKPLGFDWKIGIALLTSFAAREVFVGTMATIYSVGNDAEETSVREKMAKELRYGTKEKMYNLPTSLSLILFYAFAMQCMSTLAVTKKETNGWKWPMIQFGYMTLLAYLVSWITYNLWS